MFYMYRFGRGNWKLILDSHKDIFEERTEVSMLKVVDIYIFLLNLLIMIKLFFSG